jgi:flagellar hook-associated protein 2
MATTSATSATSGTNIDVASIVSQLMSVEQRPLTALATKEASYQAKLSAFGSIKGALSSFQSALAGLSNISKFQGVTATASDSSVLSASASSTAAAGAYTIDVTHLAQSQKLVAGGVASNTASIGNGTLTFDFGTIDISATNSHGGGSVTNGVYTDADFTSNGSGVKTLTIDATNNSLQGIRDAINSANFGVTASIVNDGGTSPYRLALSSSKLGSNNSIKISVAGDTALSDLLAHDPANNTGQKLSETAAAQNADLKVNGIAVSKASNTITDVIQGVTLNLQKLSTSTVNLTVARDTATVSASVNSFVTAYNGLVKTMQSATAYDPATKQGSILLGDSTVRSLQTQIRAVLNTPVGNTGGSITALSQIGVISQKDGSLALDTAKLSTAISSNFNDIASLFAAVGKASDSLVTYAAATSSTKPGSYALNVTSLATQGGTVGDVNLNLAPTTIASGTTINASVNGASASVALTAGTYTASQLATMIQSALNGTSAFTGSTVAATVDGSGFLHLTSNLYGSSSIVSLTDGAGTLVSDFMGTATTTGGLNVAGDIGGVSTTGAGQFLTATSGDATGLQIQVSGGITGARGTVNYSQGYAYTLNQLTTSMLSAGGLLDSRTQGINRSITDIGKQRTALNARLTDIQARYTKQFTALDTMLSSLNSTSTYLTQQLANLSYKY